MMYHMMHPSVQEPVFNMSHFPESRAGSLHMGHANAATLLETVTTNGHKHKCQQAPISDEALAEAMTSPHPVAFNCDDGTYTWLKNGWRLRTTADGTIQAFIMA